MNDILPINSLAGRGHNSGTAPLAEILAEELATARSRADDLLAAAREARIESAADAGKVADLIAIIKDQERSVDRARDERKRPYLADCRIVDAAYGAIVGSLSRARTGPGSLSERLAAWHQAHPDAALHPSIAAVGSRREIAFCIEDLPAAIGWLLNNRPGDIAQAARTILGSAIRSRGVDAVERGEVQVPGVSIRVESKTQVR